LKRRVQGARRPGGCARAEPSLLLGSRRAILVAATAFRTRELGEGVEGGAGIGVGVETDAALGAEAAPVAGGAGRDVWAWSRGKCIRRAESQPWKAPSGGG
jgi:hypothetical protein